MTDLARKRELCVKVIRSHLISCPGGLTIHQLERDYQETERQKLPFRLFGFSDTLSFLESLPDVVNINYRGPEIRLHGIADASSKHVKQLIDCQKRKRNAKGPPRFSSSNTARRPTTHGNLIKRYTVPAVASAHLQDYILRVVQKLKASVSLPLFCDLYEKEIGLPLDGITHGFNSTAHLLKSLPHICHLEFGRKDGRTGNDLYVYPLQQHQNSHTKHKADPAIRKPELSQSVQNTRAICSRTRNSPSPLVQSVTQRVSSKIEVSQSEVGEKSSFETHNLADITSNNAAMLQTVTEYCESMEKIPAAANGFASPAVASKEKLKSDILQLLKDHPGGVKSSDIPSLYEKKFKKCMDIKMLGYHSVIEFISKIGGEIIISRPQRTSDWVVSLKTNQSSTAQMGGYEEQEEMQLLKMEIREILLRAGKDISLEKLPEIYERTYHHRMNIELHDKNALINMIFTIEDAGIWNVGNKLFVRVNDIGLKSKIPADTVGPKASYRLPKLPTLDVEDPYIDIYISDVTDPSNFSIQIYGPSTTGALNELMDALESFYCNLEDDRYDLPINMIQPGQICISIFLEDLNWHRAVVTGVYDNDYADVLYVDYGTTATVPTTSLKLMKSCFLSLPMQMIKARLSHVKPRSLKSWTLEARNSMLELCRNKQLVAMVTDVQESILSLCVCDTSDLETDVHINDALVEQKHAVLFPDNLDDAQKQNLTQFYAELLDAEKNGQIIDLDNAANEFLQNGFIGGLPSENIPQDPNRGPMLEETTLPRGEMLPYLNMTLCSNAGNHSAASNANVLVSNHVANPDSVGVALRVCSPHQNEPGTAINCTVTSTSAKDPVSCSTVLNSHAISASKMTRHVQKHFFMDGMYTLHIINYEGSPMVTSFEVSLWFGQTADFLRPMLCMKSLTFEELVIGRNEKHRNLFNSVEEFDVPRTKEKDSLTDVLCLYRLRDIPSIILGLGHRHQSQMVEDVSRILRTFDNSSEYWFSDKTEENIEDLYNQRKNLVHHRISLLEKLAEKSCPDTVDQIMEIEKMIQHLTRKIDSTKPKMIEENPELKHQNLFVKTSGPRDYEPNNQFLNIFKNSENTYVSTKPKEDDSLLAAPICKLPDKAADFWPPLIDISKCGSKAGQVAPEGAAGSSPSNNFFAHQGPNSGSRNDASQQQPSQLIASSSLCVIPGPKLHTGAVEFTPRTMRSESARGITGIKNTTSQRQHNLKDQNNHHGNNRAAQSQHEFKPLSGQNLVNMSPLYANHTHESLNSGASGSMLQSQNLLNPVHGAPALSSTIQSNPESSIRGSESSIRGHGTTVGVQTSKFMPKILPPPPIQMQPMGLMPTLYTQGQLCCGQFPGNFIINQGARPPVVPVSPINYHVVYPSLSFKG